MSFGSWIALEAGTADARVTTLIGISTPIGRYDFGRIQSKHEAEVLHPRRARRRLPAQGDSRVLRKAADPKELVVIDAADHLFDGRVGDVADADRRICSEMELNMNEAVIVSAVRTPVGQGAERDRSAARGRTILRQPPFREALRRAPGARPVARSTT